MRKLKKLLIVLAMLTVIIPAQYITSEAGNIAYGAATVDTALLNVRNGPDTTYDIVYTIGCNERMVVLEKTNDEWYHINYHGVVGYVAALYLKDVLTVENFDAVGMITDDDVRMRDTPSTSGNVLMDEDNGTVVKVIGINNGWYKAVHNDVTGYIRSDLMTIVQDEITKQAGQANTGVTQVSAGEKSLRQQVVDFALQYVGYSYVYGGQSPSTGFDCSGFVYYVFHNFGYNVTRTASSQYASDGVSISKAELQPGDLVFFSSNGGYSVTHVGIYIGNNQFVHASTPRAGLIISSLDSDYYLKVWHGAKRVLS